MGILDIKYWCLPTTSHDRLIMFFLVIHFVKYVSDIIFHMIEQESGVKLSSWFYSLFQVNEVQKIIFKPTLLSLSERKTGRNIP